MTLSCFTCKTNFLPAAWQKLRYRETGRVYCGKACSTAYRAKISSETMARTNREHASKRMKERNPMRREEIRAKVSQTLKAIGHAPSVRGGNGRAPTAAEQALALVLGPLGFQNQLAVPTKMPRGLGYPTHYKLDCGNSTFRISVEADGPSHGTLARKEQDAKKDALLGLYGWTVLRFSNEEVLASPERVRSEVLSLISKWMERTLT